MKTEFEIMKNQQKTDEGRGTRGERQSADQVRLWKELHRPPPPIAHPIPRLTLPPSPTLSLTLSPKTIGHPIPRLNLHPQPSLRLKTRFSASRFNVLTFLTLLTLAVSGCTLVKYVGPNGERFTRSSLGAATAISSLTVEAGTNGLRRVELRGYQNDTTQALGTVTEAAVRAALRAAE